MSDAPWLTIIGLGEDGPDGLSPASQAALEVADIVMGPLRHLDLVPDLRAQRIKWPVPFADGIPLLMAHRGESVVVLASGDPFWFGAGSVITRELENQRVACFPRVLPRFPLSPRVSAGRWKVLPALGYMPLH